MENVSNKERACIEKSHKARLAAAKTRLAELNKRRIPFDHPLSDLTGGITWNESLVGKLKQIALLPLLLVYVLVSFIMTPIAYILHLWQSYNKKQKLRREIKALETESLSGQVPEEKTLESLWELHGLDECESSLDGRMNLLGDWVDTLYSEDVSKNLRLKFRVEVIVQRRFKINLPYYRGEEGAAHFLLAPPVDSLLRELSEELPEYE